MNNYTYPLETLVDMVKLAERQGYSREEAIQILVKHGLVSDDDDDMD